MNFLRLESREERPAKRLRLRASVGGSNPLAVLSWQPKRADAVWNRAEWTALCGHLHNENPATHFVMGFRDDTGAKRYVRSKRLTVERGISWAWTSIAGSPKSRLAYVPYAANERRESRWGGLDFDCHDGSADRARELALAAFRVLLNAPDLCVILETSGSGGWHVWAISPDFHDTTEWLRLLKDVVRLIGATLTPGICETFPPDALPSRFGKGLRAPGCWNPGTDSHSEIVWENSRTSLGSVLSGKSKTAPLNCRKLQQHFPDTRNKVISLLPLYRVGEFLQRLGITAPGTRNGKLCDLVGEVFNQVGHATARALAEAQFRGKTAATNADETAHLASFEKLWDGLAEKWTAELSDGERAAFAELATENERDAFRIIRSYALKAKRDAESDFPVGRDNLAARLGVSPQGVSWILAKLSKHGWLERTRAHVPNKFAARYRWLFTGAVQRAENEPF